MYSTDLRCRVIIQYMNGGFTPRSLAGLQQISKSTVHRWIHQSNLAKERYVARKTIPAIVKPYEPGWKTTHSQRMHNSKPRFFRNTLLVSPSDGFIHASDVLVSFENGFIK